MVDVLHVDILKYVFLVDIHIHINVFTSTSSMEFGIKCVTICACDWLLFVF